MSAKLRNKTKFFFFYSRHRWNGLEDIATATAQDSSQPAQLTASTAHSQHRARPAQLTASTAHRHQSSSRPAQLKASTSHDQQSSLLVTVSCADLELCWCRELCWLCRGLWQQLDWRTLDHDVVIMMDHDVAITIGHIDETIIYKQQDDLYCQYAKYQDQMYR